ncbi:phosphate uptake regulator PhoU [Thermincola ferriacetica]|uniref:Phosphate-specific transport system accessory protein PhoU n=2 Tax=Thermincola TaxID=278993 RepID=D5X967_THEPJ|nr:MULTISPECIES: phosphate signaling complex protein PhoU [Thermincola]ADG82971.1 phosphate uptake regulator, PhoU [Thermincola potens JR]KNZ68230.1 phosphate uptake regulator PhoU [Thermincola ferriacetica]
MGSTRNAFERSLEELQQEILRMGSLVEQAIYNSVHSLATQNVDLANQVIEGDRLVDQLELEIEDKCLKLIATQQPMAVDLRKIGTGYKIITDLERMGDHAVDIARVTRRLANERLIKPLVDIPRMAAITQEMVKEGLDAYVKMDVELARKLCSRDDEVDHIYSQIFRELLTYMMEDPRTITQATYLLFVGRYIERIADHATNLAERVVYLVTGERLDLND